MPARNPLFVWIAASIFVVSAASIPLGYRLLRRPVAAPRTLTQLAEQLSQAAPELCVVPVQENNLERGMYICVDPQPIDRLGRLTRSALIFGTPRIDRWQGVAFCERDSKFNYLLDEEVESWGEYGMRIGPLLFFGHPHLLRRIHKAIFDSQGRKMIPGGRDSKGDRSPSDPASQRRRNYFDEIASAGSYQKGQLF